MPKTKLKLAMMDPRPVDLTKRLQGSGKALKSMGLQSNGPNLGTALEGLGKNRMGVMGEKAPHAGSTPMGMFTTSGTLTNPKVAAAEDAPNYTEASSATTCANCEHYTKQDVHIGECSKHDFFARADYTCDDWSSKQTTALLRTKLRQ